MLIEQACICMNKPMEFDQYETVKHIGVDPTNGRCGDVTLKQCKYCDRYWLYYQVEYEAFTRSGRYFLGLIAPDTVRTLSPDAAIDYLNNLDWYLYGGSYFGGRKGRTTGKVPVDL